MSHWQGDTLSNAVAAGAWKTKVIPGLGAAAMSPRPPPVQVPSHAEAEDGVFHLSIPLLLWLCGFVSGLAILGERLRQTRRLAARTLPATDERLLRVFSSIPGKWRGRVELRMTREIDVPTLAGILRPQVWMPHAWPLTIHGR